MKGLASYNKICTLAYPPPRWYIGSTHIYKNYCNHLILVFVGPLGILKLKYALPEACKVSKHVPEVLGFIFKKYHPSRPVDTPFSPKVIGWLWYLLTK